MTKDIRGILRELNGLLEKRAMDEVHSGSGGYEGDNVLEGNPKATKGSGRPATSQQDGGSSRDGALSMHTPSKGQTDDGRKSTNYSTSGDTVIDGFNSGNPDDEVEGEYETHDAEDQTSKMANNVLRGLYAAMTRQKGHPKQAGRASAQRLMQQLLRVDLRKRAQEGGAEELAAAPAVPGEESPMTPAELAAKWPTLSEEERNLIASQFPELVEQALAILNSAPELMDDGKELSASQVAEYLHFKRAGAQAALQFIAQLSNGGMPKEAAAHAEMQRGAEAALADMQKVASAFQSATSQTQEVAMGRLAAERDMHKVASLEAMTKAAAVQEHAQKMAAAYTSSESARTTNQGEFVGVPHPEQYAQHKQAAYNEMLKYASAAGMDPSVLHGLLTELHAAAGGTPHPFVGRERVKSSADVAPFHPLLAGLLSEGAISQEEKQIILEAIANAENVDEQTLAMAIENIRNKEAVIRRLLNGDAQEFQRNTQAAPSPVPAMPATQPSPSAAFVEGTQAISLGATSPEIPGAVSSGLEGDALTELVVEAALRNSLKKLAPSRYRDL